MSSIIRYPGLMNDQDLANFVENLGQGSGSLFGMQSASFRPSSGIGFNDGEIEDPTGTPEYLIVPNSTPNGNSGVGSVSNGSNVPASSPSVTTVSSAASGLLINITWDSSVSSAPTGFQTAITAAAAYLESAFTNAVSVNISVGWGEVNGSTLGSSALGESVSYLTTESYSSLASAYKADATSTAQISAAASLGSSSPISGANYWLTTANAKALGLYSGTGTDGFIGFSSSLPFTYSDSAGVASGTYDLVDVALHEMTEVMGRQLLSGTTLGGIANSYDLLDLFHYSSSGVLATTSMGGYVSDNGGVTDQGDFNAVSGGDGGDWSSSMGNDSFDAFSNSGVINAFSSADTNIMNLLGWNITSPVSAKAPTGLSLATATAGLAGHLSNSAVAANTKLGTLSETGGTSSDSFSYTLGGTGAASFSLTASGNSAVLAVGANALAGSSNGKLYALTLTANNTTNGTSSPAIPLDVVVSTGAKATISLTTLLGSANTSNASFIYALGSSETINASGTSGAIFLVAGAGGDTITAGTGVMDVIFSATSNSTASAMDVIKGFAANDLLDFSGISTTLKLAGSLGTSKSIAANSIGYQSSGGNTYVYVNTSANSESLTAANMKVEIVGSHSLTSSNTIL